MRLDIASFFRSISHMRLISLLEYHIFPRLANPLIERLIRDHIENSRSHIERDISLWSYFPREKSIFSAPVGYGLPLGDLISQYLANFYLSPLDHYIKHSLKVRYYGRYMDDMIFFSRDRTLVDEWRLRVEIFVRDSLELTIHPAKTIIHPT
jgi:RNA-directed DNA polymerase